MGSGRLQYSRASCEEGEQRKEDASFCVALKETRRDVHAPFADYRNCRDLQLGETPFERKKEEIYHLPCSVQEPGSETKRNETSRGRDVSEITPRVHDCEVATYPCSIEEDESVDGDLRSKRKKVETHQFELDGKVISSSTLPVLTSAPQEDKQTKPS